jgi:hypothetical protein
MMHRTAIQVILNKRSAVAARNWKKALRELAHLAKASGG